MSTNQKIIISAVVGYFFYKYMKNKAVNNALVTQSSTKYNQAVI